MATRVGIVGASGYGGAELLRLLSSHPAIDVAEVAAHSHAGVPIADLFPNLPGGRAFDEVDTDRLGELDLVFLATPHGPALQLAPTLLAAGAKVVDLSGAHRLDAAGFLTWYGEEHPSPDLVPAVYGLTEWFRPLVGGADLVANPGCYTTTSLLSLIPLVELVEPGSIVIDGKSGTSGAGRSASDRLHHPHATGSVVTYGAPGHRHTGEIELWLSNTLDSVDNTLAVVPRSTLQLGAVQFTPHLMPMSRGLQTTSYAALRPGVGGDDVQAALVDAYADEAFVHVLAPGTFPYTKSVAGSNACQISAVVDDRTNRVVVTSVTDNLGKGAAGQALQNANLMLGFDEGLGLGAAGVYP